MSKSIEDLVIRLAKSEKDFEDCLEITKSAWTGISELEQIPIHILKASDRTGQLLVAEKKQELIGYSMSFSKTSSTLYLHAIGIKRERKSSGVGEALFKQVLKKAKQDGLKEVILTYDPLLAPNANLFIHKMRGLASMYEQDAYADTKNYITGGSSPADRFLVNYNLDLIISNKNIPLKPEIVNLGQIRALVTITTQTPVQKLEKYDLESEDKRILVEIPTNFVDLKKKILI